MFDHQQDRRTFNRAWVTALLGGATITILGCDDDEDTMPAGRTPGTAGDSVGVVSNNHGHTAVVTGAQLMANGAVALDIQGSASHTHTVSLSAGDIAAIRGGSRVSM